MSWRASVGVLLFSSFFKTPTAHSCNVTFSWLDICHIWRISELMFVSSIVRSEIDALLDQVQLKQCHV